MDEDFYTFSEYMKKEENNLTASMEDYLEMIYRLSKNNGFTRIHDLSDALNVQPPSATKMVQRLSELKLINYEKYGVILLNEKGKHLGELLLKRHNLVEEFLRLLGVSESILLKETEKIEHTVSSETLACIEDYINFIQTNPKIKDDYKIFKSMRKK